ncbi:MAG: BRO family protein [Ktedonobacterales bacterium]
MPTDDMAMTVIEQEADKSIRRIEIDGVWYFSVIDVIALLTDTQRPRKYWSDLKVSMSSKEGWFEVSAKIGQLKLTAPDGKERMTDAADTSTILRIIQSIPSPKAEPIKQWLAKIGAQKLEEMSPVPLGSSIQEAWKAKPTDDDDFVGWADFLERMAVLYRRQAHVESRLRFVESTTAAHTEQLDSIRSRLEELEHEPRMLPELLERLGPARLTPEHQVQVKRWALELHNLAGWSYRTIYDDLYTDFHVARFGDILETDWEQVENWFKQHIEAADKGR